MIIKQVLNRSTGRVLPALWFLWACAASTSANAQMAYTVNAFTDTAPSAQGSAVGAGDGPGMQGDLRWAILQANAFGTGNAGTSTITFNCGAPP